MTKSQIDYYEALTEENKYILNISALKAYSITLYDISYLAQPKFILTQKKIKIILEEAVRYKLFAQVEYMRNDWEVSVEFMMYIYPKLTSFKVEWIKIYSSYNYYSNSHLKYFRNCLYTLLHNQKEYYKEESGFISISQNIAVDYYSKLIEKK
jgi:hypothetical protein